MEKVYVTLDQREAEALVRLACKEDRDPRRQAARLIREGLEAAGELAKPDRGEPS